MKEIISQINQYFEQKRYKLILNDRQHLTDYEKDQLIPELKLRLEALKQYFNEIVSLCDVQKESPVFTQAVQAVINPHAFKADLGSPKEALSEKYFNDIKNLSRTQGVDDIDKMLEKYKIIKTVRQLGLFINDVNNFCSSLVGINNKLLLYKIETYPYFTNIKTGQVITTHPEQYYLTIEPFQILITNIVNVAKATSDTIHEWHKYAIKLKSQYLDLYTKKYSVRIHILTIFLALSVSAFFLCANDPFKLFKQNQELKRNIEILEKENKALKIKNLTKQSSGPETILRAAPGR